MHHEDGQGETSLLTEGIRRSISGIRGALALFTDEYVTNYSRGFATYLREISLTNTLVVGRDTRPSSQHFAALVIEALRAGGWDVIDVGVTPTPTVQIAISRFQAAGGLMATSRDKGRTDRMYAETIDALESIGALIGDN